MRCHVAKGLGRRTLRAFVRAGRILSRVLPPTESAQRISPSWCFVARGIGHHNRSPLTKSNRAVGLGLSFANATRHASRCGRLRIAEC